MERYKFSAIHNLYITQSSQSEHLNEGLVIPKRIMEIVDIKNGQEIILTKIGSGSWKNRIRTFAIEGEDDSNVEVRGSLTQFLEVGDLTCIIGEAYLSEEEMNMYKRDELALFDLGFDPQNNKDNTLFRLDMQYANHTKKDVNISGHEYKIQKLKRERVLKFFAKSIILGLKVNKTHPDCLQGSAEIPASVMDIAHVRKYKSVSVYNVDNGGVADTYAVPMPEGIVMTTGAMASFAPLGSIVNIVSYILSDNSNDILVNKTDGCKICE